MRRFEKNEQIGKSKKIVRKGRKKFSKNVLRF